jgi:hypothetical protein
LSLKCEFRSFQYLVIIPSGNFIICCMNRIKRFIFVVPGCEYMLWGPRAEIVDYATKQ